ncbi:hypothetical protein [Janthinobacterium agaricidamnosum]|uniref:Uncharacterized domain protein n=1 Tax=Janthinobacterium agaricidamnosum NBRC 102515 = DSM 9628 TaxID=1349767 RepID=W0V8C7_9BURK|nr:hypothetical protein [Janthinobacterium agaricidamnosum]CDG84141.1 putative uncharacterized domain protein [Janthinobacterium agaricidamnosum NBRC 102515 = DSM 9628]
MTTSSTAPAGADFTQLTPIALALAAQHGMEIVGCAKGFNALRDGDIISGDCTATEIEQWLEGYDAGRDDGGALLIVDQLLDAAFNVPRDPRSTPYKAGARAALVFRIEGVAIPTAYTAGTAEADAFSAGIEEGHAIWRRTLAAAGADSSQPRLA